MQNPLAPSKDAEYQTSLDALHLKAAQARDAGEWFDIFDEITINSVKTIMEGHGASAREPLQEWKDDKAAVRREFVAHGMPLSEEIDVEGPEQDPSRPSDPLAVLWPRGEWLKLHWPDGSSLEFRGRRAIVALSFVVWWDSFQQAFKIKQGGSDGAGKSRIVEPGSPEWQEYYRRKALDIKKGIV